MAKSKAQVQFEADTSGFTKGIRDADKSLTTLRNELRLNSTQLKENGDSVDLLAQRQNILQREHEESAKKVDNLEQKLQAAKEAFGEESNEVYNLTNRLLRAKNEFQGIQNDLTQTAQRMDNLSAATRETGDSAEQQASAYQKLQQRISSQRSELDQLKTQYAEVVLAQGKNSTEAKRLAGEIDSLSSSLAKDEKALNDVSSAADDLDNSLQDSGDGFTIMKGAMADLVADGIQSLVGGVGDAISSLFDLIDATDEYRSMLAKISGSAESFGYSVEFAESKYEQFYGYLGDDQMATNAITNLMGMKVSTDTVSDAANAAIAVWSAYGDSIPIEGLTESINESAQVAQVTGSLADAINWASRSNKDWTAAMSGHGAAQAAFNKAIAEGESQEDAFSAALAACSSTQERADLIAQTLNGTYGESKKVYDEMQGATIEANHAQLGLKDTQAGLAEAVQPVQTAFTNLKTQALDLISPAIEAVATPFADLLNWLSETPGAMQAVVGVVAGLAGAFTVLAGALAIQGIISGVSKAIAVLNGTLLANPIVLIISLIAGLVAAFVTLWNTSESFRNFWIGLWETIKSAASGVWEGIKSAADTVISALQTGWQAFSGFFVGLWNGLTTTVSTVWETIKNVVSLGIQTIGLIISAAVQIITIPFQFIWENCKGIITAAWNVIKSVVSSAINVVKSVISTGFNAVRSVITTVMNAVKSVISTIWNAIKSVVTTVVNTVKSVVTTAWNAIKSVTSSVFNAVKGVASSVWNGIKSTISGVVNGVKSTVSGVWNSIKSTTSSVFNGIKSTATSVWNAIKSAISKPINAAKDAVKGAIDKMKGFFNFSWSLPKLKLPHISISGSFSLVPPKAPKFSIKWYKDGGILTEPTMFGFNPVTGTAHVGGEAGAEAVLPIERLETWINRTLRQSNAEIAAFNNEKLDKLIAVAENILAKDSNAYLDGRKVSQALGGSNDVVSGERISLRERGLAI